MAEVTRRHRELALWTVHAVRVAPSGSELERWVDTGERGVLHGILIRSAECFADIEAEARTAATRSGVDPISLLDELEREWQAGGSNDEGENIGDALAKLRAKYSSPKGDADG